MTLPEAARNLDAAEKLIEHYGSISISAPLLVNVSEKDNPFRFALKETSQDHYATAKSATHARQSILEELQLVAAVSGAVQASPELAASASNAEKTDAERARLKARALRQRREAIVRRRDAELAAIPADLSEVEQERRRHEIQAKALDEDAALLEKEAAGTSPTPTALPELPSLGAPSVTPAKTDFLSTEKLPALADGDVPNRGALITAAGDTTTQGILSVLGAPASYVGDKDKVVLLGVTMVNVDPGWRTREDFMAEVAVEVSYEFRPVRRATMATRKTQETSETGEEAARTKRVTELLQCWNPDSQNFPRPLVAAVSPMTDVQSVDFDSGVRRRIELSLAFSAAMAKAGYKEQAAVFSSFAKQLQSNVNLRSVQASITAFSQSGGIFGFRIGPRLSAKLVPNGNQTKSRVTQQLERLSFPVLVVVIVDKADIDLMSCDATLEPTLCFKQSMRWLPQTHPIARWHWVFTRKRQSEARITDCLTKLNVAIDRLKEIASFEPFGSQARTARSMEARARNLVWLLGGSTNWQYLPHSCFERNAPADPPPQIDRVMPDRIVLDANGELAEETRLVAIGQSLDHNWSPAWLNASSGAPSPTLDATRTDSTVVLVLPKGSKPQLGANSIALSIPGSTRFPRIWTPPLTIVAAPKPAAPPTSSTDKKPVTVTRTTKSKDNEVTETYSGPPEQVELIGKFVEREKPVAIVVPEGS